MSIEKCTQFVRKMTDAKREIQYCQKAGVDKNCGGYSDFCPKPMRKYFRSDRGTPYEQITFETQKLDEQIETGRA